MGKWGKRKRTKGRRSFKGHKSRAVAKPGSPRPEGEVFDDLRRLAQSPGFIHALALLVFKSNVVTTSGEFTKEDFLKIYDRENLLRTEANLLIGLLLSADVDTALPTPAITQQYMDTAVTLLEELHQSINAPAHQAFFAALREAKTDGIQHPESPLGGGVFLREAIFYGAESAFPFQYVELAKERYGPDAAWLEANKGFNIAEAAAVMIAIRDTINDHYSNHVERFAAQLPSEWSMLPDFTFTLDDVEARSKLNREKVSAVVEAFSTKERDSDLKLSDSSSYNKAGTHPLLLLDDGSVLSFLEYNLFECIYDNPFYWIASDKIYFGRHSQTRGSFVERFTKETLAKVFGAKRVISNVIFETKSGTIVGEADAILVYGYRAFVFQAKSKKLTMSSRAGDDLSLGRDFQSAVQDAYDQAITCIENIKKGTPAFAQEALISDTEFANVREFYPICITSEHYPALSAQVRALIRLNAAVDVAYPIVLDVFTLDVIAEMLDSPLYFTDYLVKRSEAADRIFASHELVILAWYLKQNLFIEANQFVTLADDVLVELDLAMAVRRIGIPGVETPEGQLTRFVGTPIGRIIGVVNASTRPDVHRLGEVLLGLNGETADMLNRGIEKILKLTSGDRRQHDITLGLEGGHGITVHCNTLTPGEARRKLEGHCTMRKYTEQKDRWYGVSIDLTGEPRFMLGLEYPWSVDPELEKLAGDFRVRDVTHALQPDRRRKIGRNEKCPCGSGKKYKNCHGA